MSKTNSEFPEMNETARLYHENEAAIDSARKEYRVFKNKFGDWLSATVNEQLDGYLTAFTPSPTYWQFGKESWKKLNFHFELMWTNSITNLTGNTVWMHAHLEVARNKENVKAFFRNNGFLSGGKIAEIAIDFSTEESSIETAKRISELLQSKQFRELALIPDQCVKELHL